MYKLPKLEGLDLYLFLQQISLEGASEKLKYLWVSPPKEILEELKKAEEGIQRVDKKLSEASNQPFYSMLVGQFRACTNIYLEKLPRLKEDLEKCVDDDCKSSAEAIFTAIFVKGVCGAIGHFIDNHYKVLSARKI